MPSLIMCLAAMTLASWLARYPCDLNATQINVDLQELATLGMPAPGLARIGLLRLMQVVHQHGGPLPPPSAETEGEAAGEAEVSEQGPFIKMLLNMSTEYLKYDLPALLRAHETSAFLAYGDEDPGSVFFADNSSDPGSKAALIVERKDNEVQTEMIVLDSPFGEDALYYGWKEMQVEQADDGCFYILLTLYDGETVKIPESATLLSEYIVEAHFEEYNAAMDVLANAMTE